jgi:hypothetical protein
MCASTHVHVFYVRLAAVGDIAAAAGGACVVQGTLGNSQQLYYVNMLYSQCVSSGSAMKASKQ